MPEQVSRNMRQRMWNPVCIGTVRHQLNLELKTCLELKRMMTRTESFGLSSKSMDEGLDYVYRVLVVDDVEENRVLLKYVLESLDLDVLEANDGQQAVDVAGRTVPDLILMDLSMPVMDGFEATRQLKSMKETQQIPVVAVSAFCGDPAKHQQALSAGCLDCVEKPIKIVRIKSIVEQYLTAS